MNPGLKKWGTPILEGPGLCPHDVTAFVSKRRVRWLAFGLAVLMVLSCSGTPEPGRGSGSIIQEPKIVASIGGEAAEVFRSRCATCHGTTGRGDGLAAKSFPVKPRDLSDSNWQARVTDERIRRAIIGGGPAVGMSPLMTANPDLADKKSVMDDLVLIIRGLN